MAICDRMTIKQIIRIIELLDYTNLNISLGYNEKEILLLAI